jgi:hypothetical protein
MSTSPAPTRSLRGLRYAAVAVVLAVVGALAVPMAASATGSGSISGNVKGEGSPAVNIAGATVSLYDDYNELVTTATTNASGNYTLSSLEPNYYYTVRFSAPGYVSEWWDDVSYRWNSSSIPVDSDSTTGVDAVLTLDSEVSGTVTDVASGDPIEGAKVYALDESNNCTDNDGDVYDYCAFAVTDSNGHFTISGLGANDYNLYYTADGYVSMWKGNFHRQWKSDLVSVEHNDSSSGNDIALGVPATITGTVIRSSDSSPVEDARVSAYTSAGEFISSTSTDASGEYSLTGLAADTYKIEVDTDGLVTQWWSSKSRLGSATKVTVVGGETSPGKDFVLDAGSTIEGTISTSEGVVPNAQVSVLDRKRGYAATATTDSLGHYSVSGLKAGSYIVGTGYSEDLCISYVWSGGAATADAATPFTVAANVTVSNKNLTAPRCATISGTITGASAPGIPLDGVDVYLESSAGYYAGSDFTYDGTFSFDSIGPGTYYLHLTPDGDYKEIWYGGSYLRSTATPIVVAENGSVVVNPVVTVGGSIAGTVTDASTGDPVYYATVHVTGRTTGIQRSTYTDELGNYEIRGLPAETYTVQFSYYHTTGYADQWYNGANRETSSTGVVVGSGSHVTGKNAALVEGATITGSVHAASNHSVPVKYTQVTAFSSTGDYLGYDTTDRLGNFSISSVPPGSVTLEFYPWNTYQSQYWSNKSSLASATFFTVANGVTYSGKDAYLTGDSSISGSVSNAAGEDVDGIYVGSWKLVGSTYVEGDSVATDGNGQYTLPGLGAGTYKIGFFDVSTGTSFASGDGIDYVNEFWDNKSTLSSATTITVGAESHVTGKNALLSLIGALADLTATPTPTITGSAIVGYKLTAVPGTWSPSTVSLGYQWLRDGEPIVGSTSSTYTLGIDDLGATISVAVTGTKSGYTPVTKTSAETAIVTGETTGTTPTISGTTTVGETVTAVPGAWGPEGVELTYQWKRGGVPIEGATDAAYTLVADDGGQSITVTVTGTQVGFSTLSKTSAAKTIAKLIEAGTPTISGQPSVGKKLTAVPGVWNPSNASLTYRWYRNGASISGATSSTYTTTNSDFGKLLTVKVTGSKTGYATTAAESEGVLIEKAFASAPTPKVTGTPTVGEVLTATVGTWSPSPVELSYTWNRDGEPIGGEIGATYTPTLADVGSSITFSVTAVKASYTTLVLSSTPLVIGLALEATPVPTISGTPTVGQTLTADVGEWAPEDVTLTYQWKRSGSAISGATGSTRLLTSSDAGKTITVTVTGSKTDYTSVAQTSAGVKVGKAFSKSPTPKISGTPTVGSKLTASAGTWSPSSVTRKYQWCRDGEVIEGARSSSYTLTVYDLDAELTVVVTGSKSGYTTVTRESLGVTIGRAFTASPTPIISGTAATGETLTAEPGEWGPDPVALSYQWLRSGVAIDGATDSTYVVTLAEYGKSIAVAVTGTKDGYTTVTKTSASKTGYKPLTSTPTPTISGTPTVGKKLTANAGTWGPSTVTKTYRWKKNGVSISSATSSTYTIKSSDVGAEITVTVTGSKSGYATVSKTSDPVVAGFALTVTPTPTITGTPSVGETLTADAGTWQPDPVELSYQWLRDGDPIEGATDATYVVTNPDAGTLLSVSVTGSKSTYVSVVKLSSGVLIE